MRSGLYLTTIGAAFLCSCGGKPDATPQTMPLVPDLAKYPPSPHSIDRLRKLPNLQKTIQLPPIQIPVTSKVVSRGKPVTSSDRETPFEGELAYVTDGEKNGSEGYSVVIGEGPQWVQIDLGTSYFIDGVVLWHYIKSERVVNDVIVQVSDDPAFERGVTNLFNNDTDNSSGQGAGKDRSYIGHYTGRQIPGNGTKARYLRTWSNGSTDNKMNEFIEVEVWGRPAK